MATSCPAWNGRSASNPGQARSTTSFRKARHSTSTPPSTCGCGPCATTACTSASPRSSAIRMTARTKPWPSSACSLTNSRRSIHLPSTARTGSSGPSSSIAGSGSCPRSPRSPSDHSPCAARRAVREYATPQHASPPVSTPWSRWFGVVAEMSSAAGHCELLDRSAGSSGVAVPDWVRPRCASPAPAGRLLPASSREPMRRSRRLRGSANSAIAEAECAGTTLSGGDACPGAGVGARIPSAALWHRGEVGAQRSVIQMVFSWVYCSNASRPLSRPPNPEVL